MTDRKKVLITGAGSGIGRALAIVADDIGFDLILAGRTERTLVETAALCDASRVRYVVADVTSADGRAAIRDAVGDRLEYLLNNAGTPRHQGPGPAIVHRHGASQILPAAGGDGAFHRSAGFPAATVDHFEAQS